MRGLILGAVLTVAVTSVVSAKPALRDVKELDDGLFIVGFAQEIKKKCPDIASRKIKRTIEALKLRNRAINLGYTEDEIRAHVESDVEQARLRDRAATYMKSRGYAQNTEGYCALGRMEMKRKSNVGALLRHDD